MSGEPKVCTHPGCHRPLAAKGYCSTHYGRAKQGIDLDAPIRVYNPPGTKCSIEQCDRPVDSQGLCSAHYQRHRLGTDLSRPLRTRYESKTCLVEGCESPRASRGYCNAHYQRLMKGQSLDAPVRATYNRPSTSKICCILDCESPTRTLNMCSRHREQARNFNLSSVQLDVILRKGCEICGSIDTQIGIDHDHSCCSQGARSCGNCVRGGLCFNCNAALGLFKDSRDRLLSAIAYLER